ncbi:MAG TPA: SIS domain-containing protein [Roseiarcus sp.]|nr:SIS domain-containing protein [Roseiarcus sp.]
MIDNSPDGASTALVEEILDEHLDVAARMRALAPLIGAVAGEIREALRRGNKVLLCGNGGSAADSQHLATEFVVRFSKNRPALPAIALTTDTSILTAAVNDFGPEQMFARQVAALGREGDILIGLTTSGNSPNVVAALREARRRRLRAMCLTGGDGGRAKAEADLCVAVPSQSVARIQEMHIVIGHVICAMLDAAFG